MTTPITLPPVTDAHRRAHRLTERRMWDVLDGKNTRAGDVRVVGV